MPQLSDAELLRELQRKTFHYFLRYTNAQTGLVQDNSRQDSPSSITAVGLALAAYGVGVEQGYLARAEAIQKTLTTLRFLWHSPQGPGRDTTGYQGFYYHFLDMETGRRAINAELSTIDTTFLLAGALAAAQYFDRNTAEEQEIRALADALYRRADWQWALNQGLLVSHGWQPEGGFLQTRWDGYTEALLLYMLGLGSPTYPLPATSYPAWTQTYRWRKIYDHEFLFAGPLFIHQLSHLWIDFRGLQDDYMRTKGSDYFENSRRATYVQQAYAIRNPHHFIGYGEHAWGITASDGPGELTRMIAGAKRRFWGYQARGVPDGPDDGTLSPWAVVASLPFAPELVIPTIRYLDEHYPAMISELGFKCSLNPTFTVDAGAWISQGYYGLDQGPIVLMIENYLTGFLWRLMRGCPYLVNGLRRAGFTGGWLESRQVAP
jgi:hypothetical protein